MSLENPPMLKVFQNTGLPMQMKRHAGVAESRSKFAELR
jgi:hypothetical protein